MKKIIALVVIILVVIIIIVGGYAYINRKDKNEATPTVQNNNNDNEPGNSQIIKKDVEVSKIPDKFPADVPIEAGATITQNYNATSPDGRVQGTRAFATKKTVDENLKIYQDYLKNKGWKVQPVVKLDHFASVTGIRDNSQLQISIDDNTTTNIKTVSISLTQSPSVSK